MAGEYTGVNGVARKVKAQDVGISGIARKVAKGFVGVANVARRYFQSVSNPNECTITVVANYALRSGVLAMIYVNGVKKDQLVGEYYEDDIDIAQTSLKANIGDVVIVEATRARVSSFGAERPSPSSFKNVSIDNTNHKITATVIGNGTITFTLIGE